MTRAFAWLLLVGSIACTADTGQDFVEVPVFFRGADTSEFAGEGGWTITLDRADVAFGPFYLCASINPGDACERARAEMLDTVVVDALDPAPRAEGTLRGISGRVRSFMHDYGVSWLLTQTTPTATTDALEGASIVLTGRATRGDEVVVFDARVRVAPSAAGLIVARRSLGDSEEQTLTPDTRLTVVVDPRPWLAEISWDELVDPERPESLPVTFEEGTQPYRALVLGMTSLDRPTLEWE